MKIINNERKKEREMKKMKESENMNKII